MATNVKIVTSISGVGATQKGIRGIDDSLGRLEKSAKKTSETLQRSGESMSRLGTKLSLALTLPLAAASGALIKMASDAVESEDLFRIAMGDMEKEARAFSESLRKQLGLNAFQVREFLGTFQAMTTSMGIGASAALTMSKALTQLTFDLKSAFNLKPEEAFLKLQSAISGEVEPLKRLGIVVNETTTKMTAMKLGLIGVSDEMTEGQKVIARFLTIIERTKIAHANLAITMDSPANRMALLRAQFEQTAITLGSAFLPLIGTLLKAIQKWGESLGRLADKFAALDPAVKTVVAASTAFLILLGPLLKLLGVLFITIGKLAAVFAFLSTPILIVVGVLGTLIGSVKILTSLFPAFGEMIENLVEKVKGLEVFREVAASMQKFRAELKELLEAPFKDAEVTSEDVIKNMQETYKNLTEQLKTEFQKQGDAAELAAKDVKTTNEQAIKSLDRLLRDTAFSTAAVLVNINQGFSDSLFKMFRGLREGSIRIGTFLKDLWANIVDSILRELARVVANRLFAAVLGGASFGGATVGGGGGLLGGATLAAAAVPAGGGGGAIASGGGIGDFLGLGSLFGGQSVTSAINSFGASLGFAGASPASLGLQTASGAVSEASAAFTGSSGLLGSLTLSNALLAGGLGALGANLVFGGGAATSIGGGLGAAAGLAIGGPLGAIAGGLIGGGLGSLFGGPPAHPASEGTVWINNNGMPSTFNLASKHTDASAAIQLTNAVKQLVSAIASATGAHLKPGSSVGLIGFDDGLYSYRPDFGKGPPPIFGTTSKAGSAQGAISALLRANIARGMFQGVSQAEAVTALSNLGFQTGGRALVTRPTLLAVGESGTESVEVTPMGGRRQAFGGISLVINGLAVFDDISRGRFLRQVAREVRGMEARAI